MSGVIDGLVAAYRSIERQRMRGLPVCNTRLQLEAVGFRAHGGRLCGVLITPWFMNLVLLPVDDDEWSASTSGSKINCRFPAAEYEFTLCKPRGVITHLSTPLFSTVQDFTDQDLARKVALEALEQLFADANQTACADPQVAELELRGFNQPVSRRKLLRGWLSTGQG